MLTRISMFRLLVACLGLTLVLPFIIGFLPLFERCNCPKERKYKDSEHYSSSSTNAHRLAVIVPFRDRFEELLEFVPHIHKFLSVQGVDHKIYIINQGDRHRFNRASLINVGYLESRNECDYIAMHDVDLLPLNPQLNYSYPEEGPFHIASPQLHPLYHYRTFVGGILLLTNEHFELLNGMSNKYWGWGMEDDEFYARVQRSNLIIRRPLDIKTGVKDTFRHMHDRRKRKRDMAKLYNQRDANRRLDMRLGVSTVKYNVIAKYGIDINGVSAQVINVELFCNVTLTPWCDLSDDVKPIAKPVKKILKPQDAKT